MTISMYSASVPTLLRMLGSLKACLLKADVHAQARGYDGAVLVASRLAPDMLPLSRQVQIACDAAKFGVARLAGVQAPPKEDNEATLADLAARVDWTVAYLQGFQPAQVDGSEEREIQVPMRNREPLKLPGLAYLNHFMLPNFYFHVTTTYALLRHNGVELGKRDYLGN